MSMIAAFSVCCGSGFRIAVDRAERGRAATAREILRNHVAACRRYLRDDLANRGPVRLSQVETNRKRFC